MLPDRVSNPGPLTYEPGALPIALRGPACANRTDILDRMENNLLQISVLLKPCTYWTV